MFCKILALMLLTAGLLCPGQTAVSRNAAYSDVDTGVTFPAKLGSLRKTTVRINSNPVVGTRIQYSGGEGKCLATVFIYALSETPVPITDGEFEQHFRTIRQTILDQTKRAVPDGQKAALRVTEVESLGKSRFSKDGTIIYREKFLANSDQEETYHTEVVLFRVGDRIVKLRISAPAALTAENRSAEEFILAFCRLFCREQNLVFTPWKDETAAVKPEQ